jgi:hypothetical protein
VVIIFEYLINRFHNFKDKGKTFFSNKKTPPKKMGLYFETLLFIFICFLEVQLVLPLKVYLIDLRMFLVLIHYRTQDRTSKMIF